MIDPFDCPALACAPGSDGRRGKGMETDKSLVAVVRYEGPGDSVRKVVELCHGLDQVPTKARVFIKPNIVFWTRVTAFPKWGVVTTSRVIEDVVRLLKERGIDDITIGEGSSIDPKDRETARHAFETLGYEALAKRYGVRLVNVHERPFEKVDLGEGVVFNVNRDILHSDFVVNIPVLKTHAQTVVSLGIKNLKGVLDIPSRKKSHSPDPKRDLNYMISRLPRILRDCLTILDGIYTTERGPGFEGKIRRSNILAASRDILSADMVGARLLGYGPAQVPHLVHVASGEGRPMDLSDVEVVGEKIEDLAFHHDYDFPYVEGDTLHAALAKLGVKGLSYRKYDLTMCTYCSGLNGVILTAISQAWRGEPWDDVEVLTGKVMKPTPGKKKTILLGKCIFQANKDNPEIKEMIAIKGCPPSPKAIVKGFHQAGIEVNPAIFDNMGKFPGFFMKRFEGRPEFDEAFFRVA